MSNVFSVEQLSSDFLGVVPFDVTKDTSPSDFDSAREAWTMLLGKENALFDETTQADFAKTTLPQGTTPSGVLRPNCDKEVQELARIADRFNIPLHAISRGKNWGYGDACAPSDGQVIVDLRRMNRIREVNVELGYAIVEPGVSQGQMYDYLREHDLPLLLDVTGAGPDASLIGNILQRGFGHTPYGNRFLHTSGFEVVLPDGQLIKTGFGQHENSQAAEVFPWGQGPWIDGLFTQSNLGIVTSACIWLMPKPERTEAFALTVADNEQFGKVIDALRLLRMNGTVKSTVHVANDLRVLSSRIGYPWDRADQETPLPDQLRNQLRREHGLGSWNVLGGIYGTKLEVRAARRVIAKAFRGIAKTFFFDRKKLQLAQKVIPLIQWNQFGQRLSASIESAGGAFDLVEGIPSAEHLRGAFWRCRDQGTNGTDLRNSGLIWVSPVLPLRSESAFDVLRIVTPIFARYSFEPLITMTAITERSLCCVMSVNYDKQSSRETRGARACATQLYKRLAENGYYPYRKASIPK